MKRIRILFMFFCLSFAASNLNAAVKYVILFIGDGMSAAAEASLSRYLRGTDSVLQWNSFPVNVLVTTWSLSCGDDAYDTALGGTKPYPYFFSPESEKYFEANPATDSAAAATAMSTGEKTFNKNVCWKNGTKKENITDIIGKKGKFNVGIITTTLFYHATPAGFSSHNESRNNYKQIAEEILSETKPELIFAKSEYFYLNDFARQNGYCVVDSKDVSEPNVFDGAENKKIFVRLTNYSVPEPQNDFGEPSFSYKEGSAKFKDIVSISLDLMLEKKKPFFIAAEQSDIDSFSHKNDFFGMLGAVYELEEAVKTTVNLISSGKTDMNWDNSLVIVTADHATGHLRFNQTLTKGKLPDKNVILGKTLLKLNKSVEYKSKGHTNELVGCYAAGKNSELFLKYAGKKHKGTNIIDNTDIFKVLLETVSEE